MDRGRGKRSREDSNSHRDSTRRRVEPIPGPVVPLPVSVPNVSRDWSNELPLIYNQRNFASCTYLCFADLINLYLKRSRGVDVDISVQFLIDHVPKFFGLDEQFATMRFHYAGGVFPLTFEELFYFTRTIGVPVKGNYPGDTEHVHRDRNCDPPNLSDQVPRYFITGYRVPAEENSVLSHLDIHPLFAGIELYESFISSRGEGIYQGPRYTIQDGSYYITEGSTGKHAVIIVAADVVHNIAVYKYKNSWGPNFGRGGFGLIARSQRTSACSHKKIMDIQDYLQHSIGKLGDVWMAVDF